MRKQVAVVMGGLSHESEISKRSGEAVVKALQEAGYEVVPVCITQESVAEVPEGVEAVFLRSDGRGQVLTLG